MVTLAEPNAAPAVLVRRFPNRADSRDEAIRHFKRGNQLADQGHLTQALGEYEAALALVPDDPTFLTNRGAVLDWMGKHKQALASFDEVLRARPDDAIAHHNRGVALAQLGRWKEAVAAYEQAVAVGPHDAGTLANLGLALVRLDRLEDAIAALDKALALEPGDAQTRSFRTLIVTELLRRLARKRVISWAGGKPKGSDPPVPITPGPPISDYVIEDRR